MLALPDFNPCVVCSIRKVECRAFGVSCCVACKLFFRRVCKGRKTVWHCQNGKKCYDTIPPSDPKCTICRYAQCLKVGMTKEADTVSRNGGRDLQIVPSPPPNLAIENQLSQRHETLSNLLNQLTYLDTERHRTFLTNYMSTDAPLAEIIKNPFKYQQKPVSFNMKFFDWSHIEQLANIDFMKRLDFVWKLDPQDQSILLKSSYFGMSIFWNSFRNFSSGSGYIGFPGPSCPDRAVESKKFSPYLLNIIMSRLIGKLVDLQMTQNEFLLVSMVLFCDPNIPSLSVHAITQLSTFRKSYTSLLLQHCLQQDSGPSRLLELLSVYIDIKYTITDITNFFQLYQLFGLAPNWSKLYSDLLQILNS